MSENKVPGQVGKVNEELLPASKEQHFMSALGYMAVWCGEKLEMLIGTLCGASSMSDLYCNGGGNVAGDLW